MKKIIYFCATFALMLCLSACKWTDTSYRNSFESLPFAPAFSDGQGYTLAAKTKTNGVFLVKESASLYYYDRLIWTRDSALSILVFRNQDLVLIQALLEKSGAYTSSLFYRGKNIDFKVRPLGIPQVYRFVSDSLDNVYLKYESSFCGYCNNVSSDNCYGHYNLKTEEIDIQKYKKSELRKDEPRFSPLDLAH